MYSRVVGVPDETMQPFMNCMALARRVRSLPLNDDLAALGARHHDKAQHAIASLGRGRGKDICMLETEKRHSTPTAREQPYATACIAMVLNE